MIFVAQVMGTEGTRLSHQIEGNHQLFISHRIQRVSGHRSSNLPNSLNSLGMFTIGDFSYLAMFEF